MAFDFYFAGGQCQETTDLICKLNGNVLKEFCSAVEADRSLSNGKGHHISDVCNGKRKTAYGFKWIYKKDYKILEEGGKE